MTDEVRCCNGERTYPGDSEREREIGGHRMARNQALSAIHTKALRQVWDIGERKAQACESADCDS